MTHKSKMTGSNFKSDESKTAFVNDDVLDLKKKDIVYPIPGRNSVNSSSLERNSKRDIFVLIRKRYRDKPRRNIAAAYILQGLKILFEAYHIEFHHFDEKHDLIVFQDDNYDAASRNFIMDLTQIFNSIENGTQLKCKFQFMIFKQPDIQSLDDVIEDAKKFMIPVCHDDIPGAVVKFI